jgi:two-component system sensor histidine kinase/response regulator
MKTILLVDDDRHIRTTFGLALRHHGYNVIESGSGAEGLELARQHLPDLILSDIHMPGGDGSTLLREIRRDPELRHRQVVLMTGRPDMVTPRKGMEEGADDFLIKPVSREALFSCVDARIKRSSVSWRVEDQMLTQLRSLVPANLPHEFFTPLAGIIGLMEILRADLPSLSQAEIVDIHDDVYQSALRLHRTLRNYLLILDLQTVATEPVTSLPPREVEQSIGDGVNEALRQYARREDVTIRLDAPPIQARPGDLTRIVEELVDNACKYSRQGTPITVELSGDRKLVVTDQGRGLTADAIESIGAFQQFDRKKNEQQGLGLGLVLVQKLAALCRAEFSIKSEEGKGTQVQIAFPAASL